jgi:hypothetical protein
LRQSGIPHYNLLEGQRQILTSASDIDDRISLNAVPAGHPVWLARLIAPSSYFIGDFWYLLLVVGAKKCFGCLLSWQNGNWREGAFIGSRKLKLLTFPLQANESGVGNGAPRTTTTNRSPAQKCISPNSCHPHYILTISAKQPTALAIANVF